MANTWLTFMVLLFMGPLSCFATPANVLIMASMAEDLVGIGDPPAAGAEEDFNASDEIIPAEYDAPEEFAPQKDPQQQIRPFSSPVDQKEEKALPFTEPATQAPVLERPITNLLLKETAFSSPSPTPAALVSNTSKSVSNRNATAAEKDEPSSSTARLSILLKSNELFCVHQRFNFGDSVDIYYNIAPESYKRIFQFEFIIIENLIPKKDVIVYDPPHSPMVMYRESARRHGLFSISVKRGRPEEQDGALYDFCFDTSGNPYSSVATLALTRTSGQEYQVLQALVKNQLTTLASENGSSAVDPDKVPLHMLATEDDLVMLADEDKRNKLTRSTIRAIRAKLRVCSSLLRQLSDVERSGRSKAEGNFTMVNKWSAIQVGAMILSSLIQLVTIKSLFIEESWTRWFFKAIFGKKD